MYYTPKLQKIELLYYLQNTDISHFIVLYITVFTGTALKFVATLLSIKSIGAIFPIAFVHFVSLLCHCHILVILEILQTLHQQKDYDFLNIQMMVSTFLAIK